MSAPPGEAALAAPSAGVRREAVPPTPTPVRGAIGRGWYLFALATLAVPIVGATLAARRLAELPRHGAVPAFSLTDHTGGSLTASGLKGKVWVADFIFTSCSMACPRLTAEMARLQTHLRQRDLGGHARLVSISIDPERDTRERLAAYAASFGADPSLWRFATGPAKQVEDAVVRGFKQAVSREPDQASPDGFTLLHGTRLVLVDQLGQIRGYYDVNEPREMTLLRKHLAALLGSKEQAPQKAHPET